MDWNPKIMLSIPQIPLFPIYGYDNSEEAERDFEYMKHLYPQSTRMIQELIEDTCDRLEYEGSILFDEYPDRLQIAMLANRIYQQIVPSVEITELSETAAPYQEHHGNDWRPPKPGNPPPPPKPDWLRNLIEIMLCGEMCQRRRRYRSRKRWM